MALLRLDSPVLDQLDLAAALREVNMRAPSLLPRDPSLASAAKRIDTYVELLQAQLQAGLPVREAAIARARKSTRGQRRISLLTLNETVIYQALSSATVARVPDVERKRGGYEAMWKGPINDDAPAYVAMADVSSFYEYVDHELVETEAIRRSGEAGVPRSTSVLLGVLAGRAFGLPQNQWASHALAEFAISRAERALVRSGYPVWRYSDDFRIGCKSWSDTIEALEILDIELRRIGLTINEEKVFTPKIETYIDWAEAPMRRIKAIALEAHVEATRWATFSYGNDDEEDSRGDDLDETLAAQSSQFIDWWYREGHETDERAVTSLLKDALEVQIASKSPKGLYAIQRIVEHVPQATHRVSAYLSAVGSLHPDEVEPAVSSLLLTDTLSLSNWQLAWIYEAARTIPSLGVSVTDHAKETLRSTAPSYVRSKVAQLLARHDIIGLGDLASLWDTTDPASRPNIIAAASQLTDTTDARMRALIDGDQVMQWVAQDSAESLPLENTSS